ncbi:hypothetical protein JS530_10190 [Bifidobacterium sp. LC6]|uniref:Streptococcal pilin isopeptide linkage domain-containing protein n=1 Tax=Bifidobacterium colobi TaxID=2809026 RepID=A0ABS5UXK9_9BIFI|nr:FctA domain-containing protein [Bifidobacterium colobi]MBT1175860.1 hypothetical protein [Bifidobacterium colobi]
MKRSVRAFVAGAVSAAMLLAMVIPSTAMADESTTTQPTTGQNSQNAQNGSQAANAQTNQVTDGAKFTPEVTFKTENAATGADLGFTLRPADGQDVSKVGGLNADQNNTLTATAPKGANGETKVSFGELIFAAEGSYQFMVSENVPEDATATIDGKQVLYKDATVEQKATATFVKNDWSYDSVERAITVKVTTQDDGTLAAALDGDAPTFTNVYTAPKQSAKAEQPKKAAPKAQANLQNQNGTASTDSTTKAQDEPVTYVPTTFDFFDNVSTIMTAQGRSVLSMAGMWKFKIYNGDTQATYATGTNDAQGNIVWTQTAAEKKAFEEYLTFDKPTDKNKDKLVSLYMTSKNPDPDNPDVWALDKYQKKVNIKADAVLDEDNQPTGQLNVHVSGIDGGNPYNKQVVWLITYNGTALIAGTNVDGDESGLVATKKVTGATTDDEFNFHIEAANGAQITSKGVAKDSVGSTPLSVDQLNTPTKIAFNTLEMQIEDLNKAVDNGWATTSANADGSTTWNLYFKAYEDTSSLPAGYTASVGTLYFTVVVTLNKSGKITVDYKYPSGGLSFANYYGTNDVPFAFIGHKNISSDKDANVGDIADKFSFNLTADEDDAPMPSQTKTAKNDAAGNVNFGEFTFSTDNFTEDGTASQKRTRTFHYHVTEDTQNAPAGYEMDDSTQDFNIILTDDGKGNLSVAAEDANGNALSPGALFQFTNTYKPQGADVPIDATHLVSVDKDTLAKINGQYSDFDISKVYYQLSMTAADGNANKDSYWASDDASHQQIATPNATGYTPTRSFNNSTLNSRVDGLDKLGSKPFGLHFEKAGAYSFTVKSTAQGAYGFTSESKSFTVVVTDDGSGQLKSEVVYPDADTAKGEVKDKLNFTSTYKIPALVSGGLRIRKAVKGHDADASAFTFTLTGDNMTAADGTKNYAFSSTRTSSLSKVTDGVGVNDAGDGLIANGTKPVAPNDNYDFGNIAFRNITLYQPGDYQLHVTEVNSGAQGWEYADTTRDITMHARISPNGAFYTTPDKGNNFAGLFTFSDGVTGNGVFQYGEPVLNVYNAKGELAGVTGTKTLAGRDLKFGEFKFNLAPVKGTGADAKTYSKLTATTTNGKNADGSDADSANTVAFPKIAFTTESLNQAVTDGYATRESNGKGGYIWKLTYRASEDTTNLPGGVTANGQSYTDFQITVTDDDKGNLNVTGAKTGIQFSNTYAAAPAEVAGPTVAKTITGRDWKENETFQFKAAKTSLDGKTDASALSAMPALGNKATADETAANNGTNGSVTVAAPANLTGASTNAFASTEFTKPGTYVYTITESTQNGKGITASKAAYTWTVIVTDDLKGQLQATTKLAQTKGNDGKELATPGAPANNQAAFENTYDAKGSLKISGTKTITGDRTVFQEGDNFTFKLSGTSADNTAAPLPQQNGNSVTEATIDGGSAAVNGKSSANFSFGTVNYALSDIGKTYTYTVQESKAESKGGVTADTTEKTFSVAVSDDNKDGGLDLAITDGDGNALANAAALQQYLGFTNTYTATAASVTPQVKKTVVGRDSNVDFTYTLTPATGQDTTNITGLTDGKTTATVKAGVKNGETATANFGKLGFTKAGTYKFTIAEDATANGWSHDTTTRALTVTVVDTDADGFYDGTLHATATYSGNADKSTDAAAFTNTYTTKTNVQVKKTYTGKTWDTEAFKFQIAAKTGNGITNADAAAAALPNNKTITIKAPQSGTSNTGSFTGLSFSAEGAYQYTISEVNIPTLSSGTITGSKAQDVTVTVARNADGSLTATADKASYDFTNTFKPNESGTQNLVLKKSFTGRANDQWLDTDSFSFQLAPKAGVNGNKATAAQLAGVQTVQTLKGGNGVTGTQNITFDGLKFTSTGTYTYTVQELGADGQTYGKGGTKNGITYDTHTATVVYTVTQNADGSLAVSAPAITGLDGDAQDTFTNTYAAKEAQANVEATKTLNVTSGTHEMKDGDFSFTLAESDANGNVTEGGKTEPAKNSNTSADGKSADVKFPALSYTTTGIRYYVMSEDDGGNTTNGVTNSVRKYLVTVNVTDNNNGALEAAVSYSPLANAPAIGTSGKPEFVNTYSAKSTAVAINAKKELKNRAFQAGDIFDFTVTNPAGAPTYTNQTVSGDDQNVAGKNDADISFGSKTFTKAGTYDYVLAETKGSIPGITYDEQKYVAEVTVSGGQGGNFTTDLKYYKADANGNKTGDALADAPTFTNTYASTGAVTLAGKKSITGRDFQGKTAQNDVADQMTFTVTGKDATAGAAADAKVPMPAGLTADAQNANTGTLTITPTSGTEADLGFGKVNYSLKDAGKTYTYTVKETAAQGLNLTKDTSTYTVTVTVAEPDAHNGQLTVTTAVAKNSAGAGTDTSSLDFVNSYKPTTVALTGIKTITGREFQKSDSFTFNVAGGADAPAFKAATVNGTTAAGKTSAALNFGSVTFTKAGVYSYIISESKGDDVVKNTGLAADQTVKFTVAQDANGTLTVKSDGLQSFDAVSGKAVTNNFVNTYTPSSVDSSLTVQKTFAGKTWGLETFGFTLAPNAGESAVDGLAGDALTGALNDASKVGTAFNAIGKPAVALGDLATNSATGGFTFAKAGTYAYTVKENATGNDRITDDTHTAGVTFTVTAKTNDADNPYDGELHVTKTVSNTGAPADADAKINDKAAFTNTYTAAPITSNIDSADTKLTKTLTGRAWGDNDNFEFTVTNAKGADGASDADAAAAVPTDGRRGVTVGKTNINADGQQYGATAADVKATAPVKFGDFKFSKPGTYTYTVAEDTANLPAGVTASGTATVTFVVTYDATSGTLNIENGKPTVTGGDFENAYVPNGSAMLNLTGTKTLEGRDAKAIGAGEFKFDLKGRDAKAGTGVLKTVRNDAAQAGNGAEAAVNFGQLTYNKAALDKAVDAGYATYTAAADGKAAFWTVKYTASEQTNQLPAGVKGVNTSFDFNVIVTDNGEGTLTAKAVQTSGTEIADTAKFLAFKNQYTNDGSASVTPTGTKTLNGRPINGNEFGFEIAPVKADGPDWKNVVSTGTTDANVNATGTTAGITFGQLSYRKTVKANDNAVVLADAVTAGYAEQVNATTWRLHYAAREKTAVKNGVTVDGTVKNFDVLVTEDQTAGTLNAELVQAGTGATGTALTADDLAWTNTYAATDGVTSADITATKTVNGDVPGSAHDGKFTFKLSSDDPNAPLPAGNGVTEVVGEHAVTVTNAANGKVTFPGIQFDANTVGAWTSGANSAKTYTYTLSEENPATVDGVTYTKSNATYTVKVTVTDSVTSNGKLEAKVAYFAADGTTALDSSAVKFDNTYAVNGAVTLKKTFTGREWADGEQFDFTLAADDTAANAADAEAAAQGVTKDVTATKPATGNTAEFTYDGFRFTKPGTYKYTVTETNGHIAGVKYDDTPATVTFTVDQDAATGELSVKAATSKKNNTFTNTFSKLTGVKLEATKKISGANAPAPQDGKFTFAVYNNGDVDDNGQPVADAQPVATATNTGANVEFTLPDFDAVGDHDYQIIETKSEQAGVTMPTTPEVHTAHVSVTADGTTNALQAQVTYDGNSTTAPIFMNHFSASGSTAMPSVKKIVTSAGNGTQGGANWKTVEAGKFTFELTATGANAADAPMPGNTAKGGTAEATNDAQGNASFDDIAYSNADLGKTYHYQIVENQTAIAGYQLSDKTGTFDVTVAANPNDASKIVGTVTNIAGDAANAKKTGFEFTNVYSATGTTAPLNGTKNLGRNFKKGDSFTFTTKGTGVAADGKTAITAPELANGSVTIEATADETTSTKQIPFGQVTFKQPGTYTYQITETKGNLGGIAYDTKTRTVSVTATDNGDGTLKVGAWTWTQDSDNGVWTNGYTAEGWTGEQAVISAKKTVTGHAYDNTVADTFQFKLEPDTSDNFTAAHLNNISNASAQTVSVPKTIADGASATVNFTGLSFTAAGDYKFKVSEVQPDASDNAADTSANYKNGWKYDGAKHTVTVHVEDNGAGKFQLAGAITGNTPEFTNSYSNYKVSNAVAPSVSKQVTGHASQQDYKFALALASGDAAAVLGADGNQFASETVTIAGANGEIADGKTATAAFAGLSFTKPGTYTFTITDQNSPTTWTDGWQLEGGKTRTITVTVTDDNKGGLVAALAPATVDFVSNYTLQGRSNTMDPKVIKQVTGHASQSKYEFALAFASATNGATEDNVTVDGKKFDGKTAEIDGSNGQVTETQPGETFFFGNGTGLAFDKLGDYHFTVAEASPNKNDKGWTYDNSAKAITIRVTDNNKGGYQAEYVDDANEPNVARGNVTITNQYALAGTTTATLGGTKIVTGSPASDQTYEFKLVGKNGAPMPTGANGNTATVTNGAGAFNFGAITYAAADLNGAKSKDYTYELSETKAGKTEAGVAYDSAKYTVTVTVKDNNDGTVVAYTKYADANGKVVFNNDPTAQAGAATDVTFTNNATPATATITGTKKVADRTWTADDSFEFQLAADANDQATANAVAAGDVVLPNNLTTMVNGPQASGEQAFDFKNITFKKQGTYKFTVTQTTADQNGLKLQGDHIRTYTVKVTEGDKGQLVATVTDPADTVWLSTYESQPTTVSLDGLFNTTLQGRDFKAGDKLTFKIAPDTGNAAAYQGGTAEVTGSTAAHDTNVAFGFGTANYTFGDIKNVTAGADGTRDLTLKYTVTETKAEQAEGVPGTLTKSDAEVAVTINLHDDGKGNLTATVADSDKLGEDPNVFINTYEATLDYNAGDDAHGLKINTVLNGRDSFDQQYSFDLTATTMAGAEPAADAAAKLGLGASGKSTVSTKRVLDGDTDTMQAILGKATFSTNDNGKTYVYLVQEVPAKTKGYTNDTDPRLVKISVTNNYDGTLTVTTAITKLASADTTKSAVARFAVRALRALVPAAGLVLADDPGVVIDPNTPADAVYEYTLGKDIPESEGVKIDFVNSYDASTDVEGGTPGKIDAQVAMNGRSPKEGEFTFVLQPKTADGTLLDPIATVKNNADGTIDFGELHYRSIDELKQAIADGYATKVNDEPTEAGYDQYVADGNSIWELTYHVSMTGSLPTNVTMNGNTEFDVTIRVVDNGDGTLTASQVSDKLVFKTTYTAPLPETANTGASVATPAGLAMLLLLAGAGLFAAAKRRRESATPVAAARHARR